MERRLRTFTAQASPLPLVGTLGMSWVPAPITEENNLIIQLQEHQQTRSTAQTHA